MTDQEHLDTDVASATASLATLADYFKNHPQTAALDFTGLDNFVAALQGQANIEEPPAPPAPTPTP